MKKRILLPILMMFSVILSIAQTQTIASGNWSDPSIWSAGVPNSTTNAVVRHAVTINADSEVLSLNVVSPTGSVTNSKYNLLIFQDLTVSNPSAWNESGGAITQFYGTSSTISGKIYFQGFRIAKNRKGGTHTLTTNDTIFVKKYLSLFRGTIDVSSSALVLLDDATTIFNATLGYSPDGNVIGPFVWQKYVNRCNEWSTYSAPFNASLASIASYTNGRMIYTGFPTSDYPIFGFVNTYFYDEATGYTVPSSVADNLAGGKGYWYWNSNTVKNSNNESIPQEWQWQLVGNGFNSGTFTFSVTNNSDGFNLLGNPYPGMLDWDHPSWVKTNISNALYYWNTCTQSYASYVNGVGSNGASRYIPAGQGFWVQATGAPVLSVKSSALPLNFIQNQDLKTNEEQNEFSYVNIRLNSDETILRFDSNSTIDFDADFDASKLIAPSFVEAICNVRTSLNGVNYSINTVPYEDIIIPLEVKGQGELSFNGANKFSDLNIYLEDLITGDVVDMKLFNFYNFTNIEKDFTHRFNIIVKASQQLSVTEQSAYDKLSVYPNPFNNEVNVMSNGVSFDRVDIYNVLGEMVMTEVSNFPSKTINVSKLNSGIYFIKVYNNNQEIGVYMTQKM